MIEYEVFERDTLLPYIKGKFFPDDPENSPWKYSYTTVEQYNALVQKAYLLLVNFMHNQNPHLGLINGYVYKEQGLDGIDRIYITQEPYVRGYKKDKRGLSISAVTIPSTLNVFGRYIDQQLKFILDDFSGSPEYYFEKAHEIFLVGGDWKALFEGGGGRLDLNLDGLAALVDVEINADLTSVRVFIPHGHLVEIQGAEYQYGIYEEVLINSNAQGEDLLLSSDGYYSDSELAYKIFYETNKGNKFEPINKNTICGLFETEKGTFQGALRMCINAQHIMVVCAHSELYDSVLDYLQGGDLDLYKSRLSTIPKGIDTSYFKSLIPKLITYFDNESFDRISSEDFILKHIHVYSV